MDNTKTNKNFYKVLEETTRKLSTKDITIVVTDFNAKVGTDNTAFKEEIGTNVNDSMNCLQASGPHETQLPEDHISTQALTPCYLGWVSPDMRTKKTQIDHIYIYNQGVQKKSSRWVSKERCDAASNHLTCCKHQLKLEKHENRRQTIRRYDIKKTGQRQTGRIPN